jgi:hypothetical protein
LELDRISNRSYDIYCWNLRNFGDFLVSGDVKVGGGRGKRRKRERGDI